MPLTATLHRHTTTFQILKLYGIQSIVTGQIPSLNEVCY